MIGYHIFQGLYINIKTGEVLCVGGGFKESQRDANRAQNRERE